MKDLKRLARDIRNLDKDIRKETNELVKRATVDTVRLLAEHTRVDTSKGLSNWRATVGFPASREIPAYHEGEAGSTRNQSIESAAVAAEESVKNKKLGQNVFITNNVDYMDYLNSVDLYGNLSPDWPEMIADISADNWKFKYPVIRG